jgi:hypothetical protein
LSQNNSECDHAKGPNPARKEKEKNKEEEKEENIR